MIKLLFFLVLSIYSFGIFAQKSKRITSDGINTCVGAVNIFEDGDFTLQFTGKKTESPITRYFSLETVEVDNQLWVAFIAPSNGELTFSADKHSGFLQMVVFEQDRKEICTEINAGIAEIARMYIKKESHHIGLDFKTGNGFLYTLKMQKGKKINILFATEEKNTDKMHLKWHFEPEVVSISESKTLDRRFDDFAPTFSVKVRDSKTQEPLVASISIEESRGVDGLYVASDLFLNIDRKAKMKLKCDVEGYFFKDSIIETNPFEDQAILITLNRVKKGASIKIEDIEFKAGSSLITDASIPKLKRLKDFLLLNSQINIEIQGHVFAIGDNSMMGQKISEARAKRVRKYLIENGIDKDRLKAKGYGNTMPIFEEPKFSYEEQANRRVEILVL
ncbi:MAG: OmpA family protein [Fluviicola sp.]|nr:OmpA family protein [Fluviicola sp.]